MGACHVFMWFSRNSSRLRAKAKLLFISFMDEWKECFIIIMKWYNKPSCDGSFPCTSQHLLQSTNYPTTPFLVLFFFISFLCCISIFMSSILLPVFISWIAFPFLFFQFFIIFFFVSCVAFPTEFVFLIEPLLLSKRRHTHLWILLRWKASWLMALTERRHLSCRL